MSGAREGNEGARQLHSVPATSRALYVARVCVRARGRLQAVLT